MDSVQAELARLLKDQREAMQAKDIDRLMSHYSRDVVYFDVVPPLQFVGTSALRTRFTQWFESWEGPIEIEIRDLRIVASGDVAFACRFSRAVGTLRGGRQVGSWGTRHQLLRTVRSELADCARARLLAGRSHNWPRRHEPCSVTSQETADRQLSPTNRRSIGRDAPYRMSRPR